MAAVTRSLACGVAICLSVLASAPAASGQTAFGGIHSHRGGPNTGAQPVLPENSLEAFKEAHRLGSDVIELDVKLTQDDVPVVMHDQSLDRTTNCAGPVRQKTAADLAAGCRIDTLGTADKLVQAGGPGVPVPPLAEVLAWARAERALLNLEIKNQPTDTADFDSTPRFARTVLAGIEASGIPKAQVLVQSFWPANLDEAKAAGFQTSYLTLGPTNEQGIEVARQRGYDVLSSQWPPQDPSGYVQRARAAGKPVVPFTLDARQDIAAAFEAGVDGVISNDTTLALDVRYRPLCEAAQRRERRAARRYRSARRAQRRAGSPRARRRAARRVAAARRSLRRARRARRSTCARVPGAA
jgi:glycerophosphoryl diester phosphodiesterase